MPAENILVIAVDGLRAAALGAYGNTVYSTPALDQLAAESLLFDWCYADAVELPLIYRALWQSAHPLARSLAAQGYATTLVTDEPAILAYAAAEDFGDCVQVPAADATRADAVSQTAFARLFAAVCDEIESTAQAIPRLIWAHSRGMYGPWDAPLELQEPLVEREEGDPAPADAIDPPDFLLDGAHDPDAAFRWSCAYAAQVMALDACIEALCQSVEEASPRGKWLLVLCGLRGFPLGEHGRVGGVDGRLFAEQLHVPMLWRFPDGALRLSRSRELASHLELSPTLLGWVSDEIRAPAREALVSVGPAGARSIRTADWSLRYEPAEEGCEEPRCELFVRPDDRSEANDVAGLCSDVVQDLLARLGVLPAR